MGEQELRPESPSGILNKPPSLRSALRGRKTVCLCLCGECKAVLRLARGSSATSALVKIQKPCLDSGKRREVERDPGLTVF